MNIYLFGILEELTGHKVIKTGYFDSSDKLIRSLKERIPSLDEYSFQVSVNQEIVTVDTLISDHDEIALLPPFSGG